MPTQNPTPAPGSPLPPHILPIPTPSAGTGLFTTEPIAAGELIFKIDRPLITALDSGRLTDTCEWCLRVVEDGNGNDDGEAAVKLRACTGCKVARYCSKKCQSSSWTHHLAPHRPLCSLYRRLYPKVLPNTVRAAISILLLSSKTTTNKPSTETTATELSAFVALQSHLSDFRAQHAQGQKNEDGLSTWQTIELMAQATKGYSGSEMALENIQEVVARILTNTHTLTTPTFHPLGLALSPATSRLNHSCTPNAYITFSSSTLSLRSLLPIPASPSSPTEITIAYIDTTLPLSLRQAELSSRYFFTCTCPACLADKTQIISADNAKKAEEANALLTKAKSEANAAMAMEILQRAGEMLEGQALHIYPNPAIQHQVLLTALSMQNWALALKTAVRTHEDIDPVLFPQEHHPVRVVHCWVLLRLLVQVAEVCSERMSRSPSELAGLKGLRWELVVWRLWKVVGECVGRSHGAGTAFEKAVEGFGEGLVGGLKALEGSQREAARALMEKEWRLLVEMVRGRNFA